MLLFFWFLVSAVFCRTSPLVIIVIPLICQHRCAQINELRHVLIIKSDHPVGKKYSIY